PLPSGGTAGGTIEIAGAGGVVGLAGEGGMGGVAPRPPEYDPFDLQGGQGGAGFALEGEEVCAGCVTLVRSDRLISDLEVRGQKVFWTDHGTNDEFDNFLNNGRLLARGLTGGEIEVLSSTLPGPVALELTD